MICKRNIQEITESIKRLNLRIMGMEEEEEAQAKEILTMFNKIITENFPNLNKLSPYRYRKPPGHQTDLTKIGQLHNILSLKQQAKRIEKDIEGCRRGKTNNI
jgi:hypothetical protein